MKKAKYSHLFRKQLKKIRGKELQNILNKIDEILNSEGLTHYKNLTHDLKRYRRLHVNTSYVILFFGDDGVVYFVDYEPHDIIYRRGKNHFKKYQDLRFEQ